MITCRVRCLLSAVVYVMHLTAATDDWTVGAESDLEDVGVTVGDGVSPGGDLIFRFPAPSVVKIVSNRIVCFLYTNFK